MHKYSSDAVLCCISFKACAHLMVQLLMLLVAAGVYPPELKPAIGTSYVCYQDCVLATLHYLPAAL